MAQVYNRSSLGLLCLLGADACDGVGFVLEHYRPGGLLPLRIFKCVRLFRTNYIVVTKVYITLKLTVTLKTYLSSSRKQLESSQQQENQLLLV